MLVDINLSDAPLMIPRAPSKEMISVSVLEDGRTLVRINSSSLGVIQECLRKSQYLLEEKWQSENESPATVFGSAVHRALEIYYRGAIEERKLPTLEECERVAFGESVPADGNLILRAVEGFRIKAEPLASLPDTDKRSIMNGAWILHNYFKKFIDDPYVAYVDKDGPFIERGFTYRMYEDEWLIVDVFGTIDFVFLHTGNGSLIPGDHKTSSSFGFGDSSYFDRDKPNHQYTLYSLGVNRVFGIETQDFMVNVVEVKARPKTNRGSAPSFPRQVTTRTEDDYAETTASVMKSVHDYLEARSSGVWPQGPIGACSSYGACSYRQVCGAPKSLRANILNAKFKQEPQ